MKTTPFRHQQEGFDFSRDLVAYGVWWEQGTGKSKLIVDTMFHLFEKGEITGVLLVAPNGVHGNFVTQELPVHGWAECCSYVWETGRSTRKREQEQVELVCVPKSKVLSILAISYDAISRTKVGYEVTRAFLRQHKAMMVLDESTAIANPTADRSEKVLDLGPLARYRRVLSGTPVADGPFKIFNQMRFLDPLFWRKAGMANYFAFTSAFAEFEKKTASAGHQFRQLKFYRNMEYLHKLIAPYSSRVLKEDVLDLPPKLYTTVEFEMTDKQRKMYEELRTELRTTLDDHHTVTAQSTIVAMTRLQQITSGYVGTWEPPVPEIGMGVIWRGPVHMIHGVIEDLNDGEIIIRGPRVEYGQSLPMDAEEWTTTVSRQDIGLTLLGESEAVTLDIFDSYRDNPRLRALDAVLEPITHKVIIWARYRRDVDGICDMLGERCVRYDGIVGTADRKTALDRFRNDPTIQYFVANPMTLSMGVTLTQAKTVVYYSNTFQLEKRLQSEDRAHRIGQDTSVNIIDLVASKTIDDKIVSALRKKFNIAAMVNGDRAREWI